MFEEHLQKRDRLSRTNRNIRIGCIWLFGLAGMFFVIVIFVPAFISARVVANESICVSNLKAHSLSVMMYVQDWDEKFPPAARWHDLEMASKYVAKDNPNPKCPTATTPFSYAMNSSVAGQRLDQIDDPQKRIILFEMDAYTPNVVGGKQNLPDTPRHAGDNFAQVDGWAKWLPRTSTSLNWYVILICGID